MMPAFLVSVAFIFIGLMNLHTRFADTTDLIEQGVDYQASMGERFT